MKILVKSWFHCRHIHLSNFESGLLLGLWCQLRKVLTSLCSGTVTYQLGNEDECCGQCQVLYPNVRVYYWPVTKNANTWCLKYNFSSTDAATETNFDSGKAIFGTLPSDPGLNNLPTLTGSADATETEAGLPDLPTLPGVNPHPQNSDDFPTLSNIPVSTSLGTEASKTGPTSSVSPTFGIPPGGGFGLPPRDLSSITKSASLPEPSIQMLEARTFVPLNGSSVYALAPDGKHTFTSPSIYVVISTIKASDSCGQLGQVYTSLTLSFDAGQLSTVDGVTQETAVFNFADLPCPPQDWVVDNTVPNPLIGNTAMQSEMAKSYHPRILVPEKSLQNLDPTWSSSSCIIIDVGNGYDPPRPLVPVTALGDPGGPGVPKPTPAPGQSPGSPIIGPHTCQMCAEPGFHTSADGIAPSETHGPAVLTSVTAIAPDQGSQGQQDPTSIDPAEPENTEEVHSTMPALNDPSPNAPQEPQAPESPIAHHSESIPADPSPGPGIPIVSTDPQPLPQSPNPAPENPTQPADPAEPSPQPAPVPSAVVIGGQTLSNNGAPLHVNGNTAIPAPQPAPLTIPKDPAAPLAPTVPIQPVPVQPKPDSPGAQHAQAPVTIAGLTLNPVAPSPPTEPRVSAGNSPNEPLQNPANTPSPVDSPPQPIVVSGMTITPQALPKPNPGQAKPGNAPIAAGGVTLTPVQAQPGGDSSGEDAFPFAFGGSAAAGNPGVQQDHTILPVTLQPLAQASVGGSRIVFGPSHAVVAGTTIIQGAAPVVVANTPVSLGSSALVVGSSTLPLQPQQNTPTSPLAIVGGQPIVINPSNGLRIGATHLAAGSQMTVDNTIISAPQNGGAVVGSSTIQPPSPQPLSLAPAPTFVVGSSTFVGNPSSIRIGNTILSSGAAITIAKTPVSLGSAGLVIGTKTVPPASLNGLQPAADSPSAFVIAGSTLSVGGHGANVHGTSVSLAPKGVLLGGSILSLPASASLPTIAGQVVQTTSDGEVVLRGTTIRPGGPAAVIDGSTLSVLPSGSGVVVNGQSTIPISTAPTIGGQQFHTIQGGAIVIGSQTLGRGAQATISGTKVSILPNGKVSIAGSTVLFGSFSTLQQSQSGADHPTVYSMDGTALTEGSTPIYIHGTRLSLGPEGLQIGNSMVPYASLPQIPAIQALTPSPQVYSIDNTAVTEGGSPVLIHGTRVSLGPSGVLVVGSSTMHIPSYTTPSDNHEITAAPSGEYVIGGHTLMPGEVINISGTPISLGSSSDLVIGGTRTIDLDSASPSPSIFDVAGQIFTAAPGGFSIEGTSLYPGEALTISGTQVSLNPMGVVIGSKTYNLPSASVFVVDGQTLTANANGYSINGEEITFGSAATISGVPISLGTTGAIVIGTDTVPLASVTPASLASMFTLDGQIFTKNKGGYSVDGTELPSSGVVTVSSHTISAGSVIVVDSNTMPLPSVTSLSSAAAPSPSDSAQGRVETSRMFILWLTTVLLIVVALGLL